MDVTNILNADLLQYIYYFLGFIVFSVILSLLKVLAKYTKTKFDDKIVSILEKWHKENKDKMK